jgi:hypothetical protein
MVGNSDFGLSFIEPGKIKILIDKNIAYPEYYIALRLKFRCVCPGRTNFPGLL